MRPREAVEAARSAGLDALAVTDHNTMEAVPEVQAAAGDDLVVVPGEEIDAAEGQVVGLFLEAPVEPGLPARETVEAIHDQGGLAYAPHPFDPHRDALEDLAPVAGLLDAVEVRNGRCVRAAYDDAAREAARDLGLPGTGGSDAHFAREVGSCWTEVGADEATLKGLQAALRRGDVEAAGAGGRAWNHAGTKLVKAWNRVRGRA